MAIINKVIHRFVKPRSEYEENGKLFYTPIPYNVQAYSYELVDNGNPENPDDYIVRYVLGTGVSTYLDIAEGRGKDKEGNLSPALSREYIVPSESQLHSIILATVASELSLKLDKVNMPSVVYGTDDNGEQTVYSKEDFGKVDDVQLNGKSLVVDKVANIEPVAEDVKYTNPAVSSITNIQEALDDLLNIHYYVNPAYSKFTITDANSYDVGDTATNPFTITWELNKQPKAGDAQTLSLDNTKIYDIMANSESSWQSGSYEYNTNDFTATSPKTFTFKIEYTDNHSTVPSGKTNKCNASKSFSFMYRRFWGVTDTETLTDEQIWAMNNELSTTRIQDRDFDCSGGKYWWIIIPTTYCSNISFVDVASGLPMTLPDSCISTRTIENSFGVSYSVNIYRVEYKQTASSVKVKVN